MPEIRPTEPAQPEITRPEITEADPLRMQAALDAVRDKLESAPASEFHTPPALDASTAVNIAMGTIPRIAKLREHIVIEFGAERASAIDELMTLVYATAQANVELAAQDPVSDLSAAADDLAESHRLLLTDADALANRKLLDRARVDAGRPVLGYRTLINSTLVLVQVLRESWASIAHKTPLTREDLDRAEAKAQAMLRQVNEREQGTNRMPALDLRNRAFSRLVRTYGQVRRMVGYVRYWEDDADQMTPSLWSGRRRRKSVSENDNGELPTPVQPEPINPVIEGPINGGGPFAT